MIRLMKYAKLLKMNYPKNGKISGIFKSNKIIFTRT